MYHGGTWAKVDYAGAAGTTQLTGISNANVIIGFSTSTEPSTAFLYANGAFKVISVPNSFITIAQRNRAEWTHHGNDGAEWIKYTWNYCCLQVNNWDDARFIVLFGRD